MKEENKSPLVLVVLDGWGVGPKGHTNAIDQANTPFYDSLLENYPNTTLEASGLAVGIPDGMAGNSEVGHMNLGAGFVVLQDVLRINQAIDNGDFFKNESLLDLANHVNKYSSTLHITGLVSKAVVHSSFNHLLACIKFAKESGIKKTVVHVITDGRDSSPFSGVDNVQELIDFMQELNYGAIGSIVGRYYAMDRDHRWDRTKLAYDLLTKGEGLVETDPVVAIKNAYDRGETDEFIKPISIRVDGEFETVHDNDGFLFFNFRTDRPRQLTHAFVDDNFDGFEKEVVISGLHYTSMTRYEKDLRVDGICFDPPDVPNPFAKVISERGLTQMHIAESEKRAHVTYFFNGGHETPFEGEERVIVPSPKVATYDLQPEMSATGVTEALLTSIKSGEFDFIIANFANSDMVSHSGDMQASISAVETLDQQLKQIVPVLTDLGARLIITSDHGNAEQLINPDTGVIDTEHNIYPVPFIFISDVNKKVELEAGVLSDVTTTMLKLLDIDAPSDMTGKDLLAGLNVESAK
ncbi:2,3-bisphosphoglycerate-independent phosphoglycerate mutase [candidate division WWE3 bacterium]|uniref:2,3-bisphosphoglycerate-independent phosphoglycerate mutase n=1 Tax=candidate division WWE3 bacterium TaxID=2053526 RepID=A0A955RRX0_UNCKA|nr:2,3-bisphosphoglycerate-independent phosphoglycerate mutase [candidate division WWE3 bacterium]